MAYLENEIHQAQAVHDRKQEDLNRQQQIRPEIEQLGPAEAEATQLQHDIPQDIAQLTQQAAAAQAAQQTATIAQGKAEDAHARLNHASALAPRTSEIEAAVADAEAEIKELTRQIIAHGRPPRPRPARGGRPIDGGTGGDTGGTDGGDGGDGGDVTDDSELQDLVAKRNEARARLNAAKQNLAEIQQIPALTTEVTTADQQAGAARQQAAEAQKQADDTNTRVTLKQGRFAELQPALQQLAGLRLAFADADLQIAQAAQEELALWPALMKPQDNGQAQDPVAQLLAIRGELTREPMNRKALVEKSAFAETMLRTLQQQLHDAEARADLASNKVRQAQDYLNAVSEFSHKYAELAQKQQQLAQIMRDLDQAGRDRDAAWKQLQQRGGNLGRLVS